MASCDEWRQHRRPRIRRPLPVTGFLVLAIALTATACASAPPEPTIPVISWEEKLDWIIRLEDRRILRDPSPPEPVILVPATRDHPAIVAPSQPSDLLRLLTDVEARVRRRAALSIGRIGDPDGLEPLVLLLADPEPAVRRMAAFALGLLGDEAARPALLLALDDPDPILQGRAAEALGAIGVVEDANPVAAMVLRHVVAGALSGVASDELGYPLSPGTEAVRLGVFALGRLRTYEPLARAVLDARGNPVSRWWPIAYAFSVVDDERAAPVLLVLLETDGRLTPSFAARGLGALEFEMARPWLERVLEELQRPPAVVVQTIRALVALGGTSVPPMLTQIAGRLGVDPHVQGEALAGLSILPDPGGMGLLLDLLAHPAPAVRASSLGALARLDAQVFLGALSGLDPDRDWTVRAALATALGELSVEQAQPRLTEMLDDEDVRVLPAVLTALVKIGTAGMTPVLEMHLASADMGVRMTAINALTDLGDRSAVPALVAVFEASAEDPTYVVRAAALGALDTLDPMAARSFLEAALTDSKWPVRVRAAELLRARGDDVAPVAEPAPRWTGPDMAAVDRAVILDPPFSPLAYIETERGNIEVELAILDAPGTVANFMFLARQRFFDGLSLHRVVPDFVVQGGDPRGDGLGGPRYTIRDEINQRPYLRGTVGMALDWEDTGGSQFFITHAPQPHLDGRYTVFGHVVSGMEIVDQLQQGDRVISVRIWDGITPPE
jgi:cyclophilin family peptidyl-prolyl cis-trans isomerase/HEAT repeat protein